MADAKWVKIEVDMFNDPKLVIIDSMEDNNLIHYIWTSSILLAGQCNRSGKLYISEGKPYTYKTLSLIFRRDISEVKKAFKVLIKLEMIEITDDKVFKIKNWEKHQNIESLDKIRRQTNERVMKHREKKREEKKAASEISNLDGINEDVDLPEENKLHGVVKINDLKNDEICNVTCNATPEVNDEDCNVTETGHNRKKIKKKKKDRDKDEMSVSDNQITEQVAELAEYFERVTGNLCVLDIGALKLAIDMHTKENVKLAIDKAIETGKMNMPYINGILKNWRKEGYPKKDDAGGIDYGGKCNNQSTRQDKNEFKNIKPKKARELTEQEKAKLNECII